MITFKPDEFELLSECPWCNSLKNEHWGEELRGFKTVRCSLCGLIYVKNRLTQKGLIKCYKDYLNEFHVADKLLNQQRNKMYSLEFNFVNRFITKKRKSVLDVGCSGGYFLDLFRMDGYVCFGVELGDAAAREASKKYRVWEGEFPDLVIDRKFDLIMFRGVIQYFPRPKEYLDKALGLLKRGALIYVTSTPNADAICCDLFKEKWNMHIPEHHLMHFRVDHFDKYFEGQGFKKLAEYFFYQETPYAEPFSDILRVAQAIKITTSNKKISFRSPAFWNNMMSLIYQVQ